MRRIAIAHLMLALLSLVAAPARAGLVVSIGSTSIVQGGTGSIDVYLSSTASPSMPDQINDYSFTLQILPEGTGNLEFSASQSFGYLNSSQYVFFGDSADYIAGTISPPPVGGFSFTSSGGYNNDSFLGFDNTHSFNPVSLSTSSGQVLLATLSLDASITSAGETFTIALVPDMGSGSSNGGASTYFNVVDSNFNELSAVPFTSSSGAVTIITSAVPEPASIVGCLTAAAIAFLASRRHRR
jgi:hypothetical protein